MLATMARPLQDRCPRCAVGRADTIFGGGDVEFRYRKSQKGAPSAITWVRWKVTPGGRYLPIW
jgi:hypothetical protein